MKMRIATHYGYLQNDRLLTHLLHTHADIEY